MANLKELLQQVSEIVLKEKTLQEEKRKRGDNFNVFNILGLQASEVRLHSALIAELLNPIGGHGLGDKFMEAFLDTINNHYKEPFCLDTKSANVIVEHVIGAISEDGESGGRIDIIIRDNLGQTIIIENKIYAEDQYRQMSRYNKYAKDELKLTEKHVKLLYLTLDGDAPTEISLGKEKFVFSCISYREDILNWLDKCLALSALYPIVRETIRQYILILKQLTNQDMEDQEQLLKSMASNVDAVTAILNAQENYKRYVYKTFVKTEFEAFCEQRNLKFKEDPNLFAKTGQKGYCFHKEEWKSSAIWIYSPSSGSGEAFRIGISDDQGGATMKNVEKNKLDCLDRTADDEWPYGWKLLEEYSQWNWKTFEAMVKGYYMKYIEEKVLEILEEIESQKIHMP